MTFKQNMNIEGINSSREQLVAKKFIENFINKGKIGDLELVDSPENILKIKEFISKLGSRLMPGAFSVDEVILELKKDNTIKPKVVENKAAAQKEPEHIGIEHKNIELKIVNDEMLSKVAKENIDREEDIKQRKFIFENKDIVDELIKKAEEKLDSDFNSEDYVKGGLYSQEEVNFHNNKVSELKELFEKQNTPEKKEAQKLAKIFEAIVVEGVNLSKCLGEEVVARPAAPYDDIFKPKIDSYLLLKDVSLGVDVSMRNINGEAFVEKIEKNLRKIISGQDSDINYHKDVNGKLGKDVFAPKVIISCDTSMIKDLMLDFKNLSSEEFSKKLRNHRMSREIVSQVISQCKIFAKFAKEAKQTQFAEHYNEVVSIINKIAEDSPFLKRLMVGTGGDAVSKRIQEIVDEFKEKESQKDIELQEFRNSKNDLAA